MSIKQTLKITFKLFQNLSHAIIIEIIENNNSVFYENKNIMNYCKNNEKKKIPANDNSTSDIFQRADSTHQKKANQFFKIWFSVELSRFAGTDLLSLNLQLLLLQNLNVYNNNNNTYNKFYGNNLDMDLKISNLN